MSGFDLASVPLVLSPEALAGKEGDLSWHQSCLVQAMLGAGYGWDELPADLRSMFALGYYIGNVENGGHSQFIGNAFGYYHSVGPLPMLDWAHEAALRFGMNETCTVIAKARDWLVENPASAQQQTGFTGGRDPALDPLDVALYRADLRSEADWLAVLAPLGPKVADHQARGQFYRHKDHPLTFPCAAFSNHLAVALISREPRQVVAKDAVQSTISALVRALPQARGKVLAQSYPLILQAMPNPQDCAVLHALEQYDFYRDAAPSDGLSLGQSRGEVYAAVRNGASAYFAAKTDDSGTITLHATTGHPLTLSSILYFAPRKPVTGLWSWLRRHFDADDRKQRRWRAALAKHDAQSSLRVANLIAQSTLSHGQAVAESLHSGFVAEALALYQFDKGERNLLFRRLIRCSDSKEIGQDWRLSTLADKPIDMFVRADRVEFRAPGEAVARYDIADLQAVRAQFLG